MGELIHFVATWAEPVCGPHRAEVAAAAQRLGLSVHESDVDAEPDLCRQYRVLNVPAVALQGQPGSRIVGAVGADEIVTRLSEGS
jgi:hypothetical protein